MLFEPEQSLNKHNDSWIKLSHISELAKINLFCLPFAGGYAEFYLSWLKYLSSEFSLFPVQLPGRSYLWQQPVISNIDELIPRLFNNLREVITEKPYVLFGHSMGGYIAYELCKKLTETDLPLPIYLIVSSVPAPKWWSARQKISKLNKQSFQEFFYNLGGIDPEFLKHESFFNQQMDLLRKDLILCESCSYLNPQLFPIPILALGGLSDEYIKIENLSEWQIETSKDFSLETFSGNHFYLKEHLPTLLSIIKSKVKM